MFNSSEILFHTAGNDLLYKETELNKKHGILQLRLNDEKIHEKMREPKYILFSVDCSASMTDPTNNYHTKLYQAVHTLKRIFLEFANESEKTGAQIHVAVMGFEQKLHAILEFTHITQKNVNEINEKLDMIKAHTCTNIEIA